MSADPRRRAIALAITGASGALYATRTLAALLERGCHVELIVSEYGRRLLRDELGDAAAVDKLPDYLAATYGDAEAARWHGRWRIFFLACAELFGYRDGDEWWVSHVRLAPRQDPRLAPRHSR